MQVQKRVNILKAGMVIAELSKFTVLVCHMSTVGFEIFAKKTGVIIDHFSSEINERFPIDAVSPFTR